MKNTQTDTKSKSAVYIVGAKQQLLFLTNISCNKQLRSEFIHHSTRNPLLLLGEVQLCTAQTRKLKSNWVGYFVVVFFLCCFVFFLCFFLGMVLCHRRKHKRVWNTLKVSKLVCFTNVQLKTQNSASAIVHSCFSAANETSLCEPAFLFLCGPLIAKTGCTLHCLLTHCIHRQVAQRRNNGSPIHSICAAFQVGLSQTFSHSQKGPEEGATIGVITITLSFCANVS